MTIKITDVEIKDIRFPTSKLLAGSDAMNPEPDYSAPYVILKTNQEGLEGHGLTFTIGRGNDICVKAIEHLKKFVLNYELKTITDNMGIWWEDITSGDSQLRWLGPEKGVIHITTAAIVNAVWDLWAKSVQKPLWQLIADMPPEDLVRCISFRYITDVLTKEDALQILTINQNQKQERINYLKTQGYPAYNTSVGWLGYSDEKVRQLCEDAKNEGWTSFKFKVGKNKNEDIQRLTIAREVLGEDVRIMVDANQRWEVKEAIEWIAELKKFNLWWIEEPTSPDDVVGHAKIAREIKPTHVATGEHCHNRVSFKQFFEINGLSICQIDSCRLAGVNEVLAVMLMAAKFGIPVCPHAGGVGLCEYVQHLSMVDYVCISGTLENRMIEYVEQLHEHFLNPVVIKNGHYQVPLAPGYSIEMKPQSLLTYSYPDGEEWKDTNSLAGSKISFFGSNNSERPSIAEEFNDRSSKRKCCVII